MKILKTTFFLALLFSAQFLIAQQVAPPDYQAIANEHLKLLKSGVLVVRLPSNTKKMRELSKLIDQRKADQKDATKLTEMYNATLAETRAFNQRLITAVSEHYTFSEVLFIHDTASIALRKGVTKGIFLDKFGKTAPNIELQNDNWLLGAVEYQGFPKDLAFERLVVQTKKGKQLEMPFPKADKSALWIKFGSSDERDIFKIRKSIVRFNQRLESKYKKLMRKNEE